MQEISGLARSASEREELLATALLQSPFRTKCPWHSFLFCLIQRQVQRGHRCNSSYCYFFFYLIILCIFVAFASFWEQYKYIVSQSEPYITFLHTTIFHGRWEGSVKWNEEEPTLSDHSQILYTLQQMKSGFGNHANESQHCSHWGCG